MEAPTLIANRRICSVCGEPQPLDGSPCPKDGSTIFTSASLALENTLPTSLRDPLLGQKLGDYEVHQVIGEGGMGIVYRGVQPVIQKNVAIKVLRSEVSGDALLVKRFLAEARAVTAIGHRNIIDVFTLGELPDGRPYIVMEFLEGIPLDKYLKERAPLTPTEAVELLIEITAPLNAAHTAGIIHRDLKPSNVFLVKQNDGTRYLKLLDFGLAKQSFDGHSAQTSAMMVTGTPDYMSPEQARGAEVSPRSDLYSLGVMAYEMVTGTIPFKGATPMDVLIKHVQAIPQRPGELVEGLPQSLEMVIMSLLEKQPTARLSPTEKVRTELKRVQREMLSGNTRLAAGPRPLATPGELPELPGRGASPSRGLVLGVAAAAVAVLGAGATFFATRDSEAPAPVVVPLPPPKPKVVPPPPEPVAVAAVTPEPPPPPPVVAEPAAPKKTKVVPKPAESATVEALTARIGKLENRLKKATEPGEEPDPAAMVLLKKIKVQAVASHTPEERAEVQKSLDGWEKTFLPR